MGDPYGRALTGERITGRDNGGPTAREREKYNLLRFSKLGLRSFAMLCPRG